MFPFIDTFQEPRVICRLFLDQVYKLAPDTGVSDWFLIITVRLCIFYGNAIHVTLCAYKADQ